MFSVSQRTTLEAQQGSLKLEDLQLWQTVTAQGKKWEIISKSEQPNAEGSLIVEGKALQQLFKAAAAERPIFDNRYQDLGNIREFRLFAKSLSKNETNSQEIEKSTIDGLSHSINEVFHGVIEIRTGDSSKDTFIIPSSSQLVSINILLSPETLNIEESLLKEIESVLSKNNFDMKRTPISAITLLSKPTDRNRVMRLELKNSDEHVIFKESNPMTERGKAVNSEDIDENALKEALNRLSKDWAGLEFASGLQKETPLCPQFYGGSKEHRFILQQDLGKKQEAFADHLLKGTALEASKSLNRYMTCLGNLHGIASTNVNRYREILHAINPEAQIISAKDLEKESLENINSVLAALKLNPLKDSERLEKEIEEIVKSMHTSEGHFITVTHGDPCPDNTFDYSEKLLLIDFEWGAVESSLLDATYPRMSMPSAGICAAQFPEELLSIAETTYRDELKKHIPAAADDRIYFKEYAQACAMHMLTRNMAYLPRVIDQEDTSWGGISVRSRILTHLQTFVDVSQKYDVLPELRSITIFILEDVKEKWKDAHPLDLYPAFTKK